MTGFAQALLVGAGGFCGAVSRYLVGRWLPRRNAGAFPLATWLINVTGSFLLGLLAGASAPHWTLLLVGTGFMGAYTTFSTLSMDAVQLAGAGIGRRGTAVWYVVATYAVGIAAAFAGCALGDWL